MPARGVGAALALPFADTEECALGPTSVRPHDSWVLHPFFRRHRVSGPGGKELKARRKEFKAKRKEMKTLHKEMKIRRKEMKI